MRNFIQKWGVVAFLFAPTISSATAVHSLTKAPMLFRPRIVHENLSDCLLIPARLVNQNPSGQLHWREALLIPRTELPIESVYNAIYGESLGNMKQSDRPLAIQSRINEMNASLPKIHDGLRLFILHRAKEFYNSSNTDEVYEAWLYGIQKAITSIESVEHLIKDEPQYFSVKSLKELNAPLAIFLERLRDLRSGVYPLTIEKLKTTLKITAADEAEYETRFAQHLKNVSPKGNGK